MRLPDVYGLTADAEELPEGKGQKKTAVGQGAADSDTDEEGDGDGGTSSEEEEAEVQGPVKHADVEIDLALGAFANARSHYEARKKHNEKVRAQPRLWAPSALGVGTAARSLGPPTIPTLGTNNPWAFSMTGRLLTCSVLLDL